MEAKLKSLILHRAEAERLGAFSCFDFTDLASYKTVSKCLERLEDDKKISRVLPGIYRLREVDSELGLPIPPSVDEAVAAVARKNMWEICPTGDAALNAFGLSTQVVASYVYLSTGPYKKYTIGKSLVLLKHTMNRELLSYSRVTCLMVQAIKTLGQARFNDETKRIMAAKLSDEEKRNALFETTRVRSWIRRIIVDVCGICNESVAKEKERTKGGHI